MAESILRIFQPRPTEQRRASNVSQEIWPSQNRVLDHAEDYNDPDDQRTAFVSIIDEHGFNAKVFAVAASGFFTDSYNLFASNVILPAVAFVYWESNNTPGNYLAINALTLTGSCVGQVLFGFLADIWGRQRLYGVELVIVIFATLGFAASGPGVNIDGKTSMSITSWLMFWKFLIGVGIGAEYPLSAAITIEWAARKSRARMMSAVFLMQPLGQFCAYGIGLAVLHGLSTPFGRYNFKHDGDGDHARIGMDKLWRIVSGVGCVPAIIALIFRWAIPESGRYTYDMKSDAQRALTDTKRGVEPLRSLIANPFSRNPDTEQVERADVAQPDQVESGLPREIGQHSIQMRDFARNEQHQQDNSEPREAGLHGTQGLPTPATDEINRHSQTTPNVPWGSKQTTVEVSEEQDGESEREWNGNGDDELQTWNQFSRAELHQYWIQGGNWRHLFGACICWFFLDVPFYGLGFNNPATLAKLWADSDNEDPTSIFSRLNDNGIHAIIAVSIWSLLGCAWLTWRIRFINRRHTLIWTSTLVALLLLVTAILFPHLYRTSYHAGLIVLYAIIQIYFSFGPNTLIFVFLAEIFPTRYRCSAYGIAAASGKLGAIVAQVIYHHFAIEDPTSDAFGRIMYLFAVCMLIVALSAWWFLPNVQEPGPGTEVQTIFGKSYVLKPKTLELLGEGREMQPEQEKVAIRNRTRAFKKRISDNVRRHGNE